MSDKTNLIPPTSAETFYEEAQRCAAQAIAMQFREEHRGRRAETRQELVEWLGHRTNDDVWLKNIYHKFNMPGERFAQTKPNFYEDLRNYLHTGVFSNGSSTQNEKHPPNKKEPDNQYQGSLYSKIMSFFTA